MKKSLLLIAVLCSFIVVSVTPTHAQNSQTTITSITVPGSVSADVVAKVTKAAPIIMSIIDNEGGYDSAMYNSYITALTAYSARFEANGDTKREWIANTLIAYAKAYYDVAGQEVTVVEVPVEEETETQNPFEEVPTEVVIEDYTDLQEQLDDMEALWAVQNLRNYTMVQQLGCFCTPDFTRPIRFEVENGRVEQRTANYYDGARESVQTLNGPTLITIEGYFDLIQQAIDDGAASIDAEFDTERGYPTTINIDYNTMIADEERYYTVRVF